MLKVYHGDTLSIPMSSKSPLDVPTDFTGAEVRFTFSTSPEINELTPGVTIDRSTPGSINVTVDKSLTRVIPGIYEVLLQITYANGISKTLYCLPVLIEGGQ